MEMRALLRIAAAPLLLVVAGTLVALALGEGWNRELLLAGTLRFTLAYLAVLSRPDFPFLPGLLARLERLEQEIGLPLPFNRMSQPSG